MDQDAGEKLVTASRPARRRRRKFTRRQALKYGLVGTAGLAGGYGAVRYVVHLLGPGSPAAAEVARIARGDAPSGKLWELWKGRGWVAEARHYLKLGQNVQCKLCPNDCLLRPEDRGRCRTRVNKDGTLYTLAYANPCAFHADPIEKKPLYHFLPGTRSLSIATPGCGFRCLNCQNWDLSQRKPEELKDPRGEEFVLTPGRLRELTADNVHRMSMFPKDVVALAKHFDSPSVAYTYSEPTTFYEYMLDTCKLARSEQVRNVWVTCGYINRKPLLELCQYLDAANVDLKSFSEKIYRKLNSGKLQPILDTLKTLKERGVWFEVTNLVVPTYTDDLEMIARMCDWLLANIGPDYPLHFSRFHPAHRLMHLSATPVRTLMAARDIAVKAGLRYVYIGNVRGLPEASRTKCPGCGRAVVERDVYAVRSMNIQDGKCKFCKAQIAGVWTL